jgi:hypothetical protein
VITYNAACAVPQVSPVAQNSTSLEVDLGKMDAIAKMSLVSSLDIIIKDLRYFPSMRSHDVRVAVIIPMRTDVISFERNMHSLTPLALVPNISGREDNLSIISHSSRN